MRLSRALVFFASMLLLSGCGYIHFGRLPKAGPTDAALERAYSDLATERKVLQQELVLARQETETLRTAIEKTAGLPVASAPAPEMAKQLEETTRELASLRASYAILRAERSGPAAAATSAADARLAETQEKLATTQREYAQLQDENARLRHDLDATRSENATLARQLKSSVADTQQAQTAAAQLSTELETQKRARERAEQLTSALRAQLEAVLARAERAGSAPASEATTATPEPSAPEPTATTTPAPAPASATTSLAGLKSAKEPPSGAVPTVELRSNGGRARVSAGTATAPSIVARPTPTESQPAEPAAASSASTASTAVTEAPAPSSEPSAAAVPPAANAAAPEVATSAPSTTPSSTSTAAPATPRTYTVQRGDTLEKISLHFYGVADQWGKIYAANVDAFSASGGLKPGMELQIPEK